MPAERDGDRAVDAGRPPASRARSRSPTARARRRPRGWPGRRGRARFRPSSSVGGSVASSSILRESISACGELAERAEDQRQAARAPRPQRRVGDDQRLGDVAEVETLAEARRACAPPSARSFVSADDDTRRRRCRRARRRPASCEVDSRLRDDAALEVVAAPVLDDEAQERVAAEVGDEDRAGAPAPRSSAVTIASTTRPAAS